MSIDSIADPSIGEVRLERYEWGLSQRVESRAGVVQGDLVVVVDAVDKLSVFSLDEAMKILETEKIWKDDPFGKREVTCHLCGEKFAMDPPKRTITNELPHVHDRCLDSFIDCLYELLDRNPEHLTADKI